MPLTITLCTPKLVNMKVTPLARAIKQLRAQHGVTVRELAEQLGKSPAYIAKIEVAGEVPSLALIAKLAERFGEPPARLLELARRSELADATREIHTRYLSALTDVRQATRVGQSDTTGGDERMAMSVSLINMKGGVGKTTMAAQLAHAADQADLRVLAIDLDPQSNLSQALMNPKQYVAHLQSNKPTVTQIFDEYVPAGGGNGAPRRLDIDEIIIKNTGYWAKSTLDLIPSRLELSRTLKNPTGKSRRLAKAIAQVSKRYDLILIDCAPTESILTEAAYFASRHLIVPIKPEFMATIGLPLLARSLNEFQLENDDHEIDIAGLVFNHSSSYSSGPEGQQSIAEVTKFAAEHGWYVCENQMKYSASYAKSAREGTPIGKTSFARSDVVSGFRRLKDEIFGILGIAPVTT
jgi:chromosome partitioning protein